MTEDKVYNPLDKRNLGECVAEALLESIAHPLPIKQSFKGAGIYVIYYFGNFPAYENLAKENKGGKLKRPIYIGKAIPAGGRKGKVDLSVDVGEVLFRRLNEHAESIQAAKNLDIKDFRCRFLAVDDIWIPLGESLLIAKFNPLWNAVVEGFGNHNPGGPRFNGMRPIWDTLHPGRKWAEKCKESKKTRIEILGDIKAFLSVVDE